MAPVLFLFLMHKQYLVMESLQLGWAWGLNYYTLLVAAGPTWHWPGCSEAIQLQQLHSTTTFTWRESKMFVQMSTIDPRVLVAFKTEESWRQLVEYSRALQ
jgi:hypothetical protein